MKHLKVFVCFALAILMLGVSATSFALTETPEDDQATKNARKNDSIEVEIATTDDTLFEEITREEYLQHKAEREGISYEQAAEIVDAAIENTLDSLPSPISPMAWQGTDIFDNGDATYTIYGRVYSTHNSIMGMSVHYETEAVKVYHHYGSYWIDCVSTGTVYPTGSGVYTFTGTVSATIISSDITQLRMALSGYYQVEADLALDAGYEVGDFSVSVTIGTTVYFRKNVYTTMIEHAM